jgi:hypothetical protein
MCRQVLHKAQLEDRKLLTSQVGQVDDMYESLAAHEQKVPTTDQVKHDDLTEALANFQNQLTEVSAALYIVLAHLIPALVFGLCIDMSWHIEALLSHSL